MYIYITNWNLVQRERLTFLESYFKLPKTRHKVSSNAISSITAPD